VNPLWSNIFRKKPEEDSLAHFLGGVPIFSLLEKRDLVLLENLVHVRHYTPGEIVFEEGDPGSGLYIIRSGSVRIFHRDDGAEEGIALLGPGDFFGETTLTSPAVRSASARTMESTELVGLFRADLLEMAQKHPAAANRILLGLIGIVSERLRSAGLEIRRLRAMQSESPTPSGELKTLKR